MITAEFHNRILTFNGHTFDELNQIYNDMVFDLLKYSIGFYKPIACKVTSYSTSIFDLQLNKQNILINIGDLGISVQDAMNMANDLILANGEGKIYKLSSGVEFDLAHLRLFLPCYPGNIEFTMDSVNPEYIREPLTLSQDFYVPSKSQGFIDFLLRKGTGEDTIFDNSKLLEELEIKDYYPMHTTYNLNPFISIPIQDLSANSIRFIYKSDINESCFKYILKDYLMDKEVILR